MKRTGKMAKRKGKGEVRVLSNGITNLCQKIQNTAQIDILTTGKRRKSVAIMHVCWTENYQNCGQGSPGETSGVDR